jgi:hypothetical protein
VEEGQWASSTSWRLPASFWSTLVRKNGNDEQFYSNMQVRAGANQSRGWCHA